MSDPVLSASLGEEQSLPNRVIVTPDTYASILLGFPDLVSYLFLSIRSPT